MHICPSPLTIDVVPQLWGHPDLCPGLREKLGMTVTGTQETAVVFVDRMLEYRVGGGGGQRTDVERATLRICGVVLGIKDSSGKQANRSQVIQELTPIS